jgi:hypothetical protein
MIATHLLLAPLLLPHVHEHEHAHDHAQDPEWKRAERSATPVFVGAGEHRYRWDADWMKLPAGREWLGSTHGCIVVDRDERVYVSAETGPAVLVFAPDGTLERSFGADLQGGLHGMSIAVETAPDGGEREVLFLVHTGKQRVLKTTLSGKVLLAVEPPPASSGLYPDAGRYKPTSVAVAPDGTLFVADGYGLSWIHRYDAQGEYLDSFGGPGDAAHNLRTPHGLWMDTLSTPPTLLVADRENHRLARFSLAGEFLGGTDPASGLLRRPCHVQFHGELGVVSDLAGRATLIDAKLQLVGHLGDNPDPGQRANYGVTPDLWREGHFLAPHCARFNGAGDLFVMDWNVAGRLTRLVRAPEAPK